MGLRTILVTGTLALTLLGATESFATAIPRGHPSKAEASYAFEKHLYGYSNIVVEPNGNATAWALFTSELKLAGERNVQLIIKIYSGKDILYVTRLKAHLADAMFHGGHVKKRVEAKFSLTPDQWASVTDIKYDWHRPPTTDECRFFNKKYKEGNVLMEPKFIGCPN